MKSILIADDSKLARSIVKEIVTKHGYEVIGEAVDGEDAIEKHHVLQPDFVTMDVTMPKLNGFTAASIILTKYPSAKIIAITSIVDKKKTMMALKKGVKQVITKPISEDELIKALKRWET